MSWQISMEHLLLPDAQWVDPPETAVWIATPHPFDLHEVYLNFRSPRWSWDGSGTVNLWITADSRYKLWINGRYCHRGPARSWPHAQKIDHIDITDWLLEGHNVLAVQVYQPGYSHFSTVHVGAVGLLAWLEQDDEPFLVTNSQWLAKRDGSFSSDVPRVSIYGSGVEQRDLRIAEQWQTAVFDDANWLPARIVDSANGAIWSGLQKRGTPLMTERGAEMTLLDHRTTHGNVDRFTHETVAEMWQKQTGDGQTKVESWLYDLGRAFSCQGWVEVKNARGGEQLAICYMEKIRDGELVTSDPTTYCRMRPTDLFTLKAGEQTVEPFTVRGGRYVLFQLVGASSFIELTHHVHLFEYPLTVTKPLQTDDQQLDRIISMCETTVHACLQDTFVDCVWRENSQWLGDALMQGLSLSAMGDDLRPLTTVLLDTAQGIYPDGILPSVAPAEVHAYTIPRYNCMWGELLVHYWSLTQDESFVQLLWPTLRQMVAGLLALKNEEGLLVHPPGRRFYIDWSATAQSDPHLVFNLHVVLLLQMMVEMAQKFDPAEVDPWQREADELRQRCGERFGGNGRYYDDLAHTTYSQLGAAFALLTETAQSSEVDSLLDQILARSLNASDAYAEGEMVLASPFMHHYLFEALGKYGRNEALINIIKMRWGRWVAQGFPTTWENWNVDFPDGSQCHAFSAHPRYHLAKIFNNLRGDKSSRTH